MKKTVMFLMLLLPWLWTASADNVSQQRAAEVASAFFRPAGSGISPASVPSLRMVLSSKSLPKTSGEAGEHTLYLMSEANDSENERSASLIIRSGSLEKSMTIVQKSYSQYAGRLTLIHTDNFYKVPLIDGSSFNGGTVDWGDGTKEEYVTDLTHEYAGTGPYSVVIDVVAAETFYLPDIVGLFRSSEACA